MHEVDRRLSFEGRGARVAPQATRDEVLEVLHLGASGLRHRSGALLEVGVLVLDVGGLDVVPKRYDVGDRGDSQAAGFRQKRLQGLEVLLDPARNHPALARGVDAEEGVANPEGGREQPPPRFRPGGPQRRVRVEPGVETPLRLLLDGFRECGDVTARHGLVVPEDRPPDRGARQDVRHVGMGHGIGDLGAQARLAQIVEDQRENQRLDGEARAQVREEHEMLLETGIGLAERHDVEPRRVEHLVQEPGGGLLPLFELV